MKTIEELTAEVAKLKDDVSGLIQVAHQLNVELAERVKGWPYEVISREIPGGR